MSLSPSDFHSAMAQARKQARKQHEALVEKERLAEEKRLEQISSWLFPKLSQYMIDCLAGGGEGVLESGEMITCYGRMIEKEWGSLDYKTMNELLVRFAKNYGLKYRIKKRGPFHLYLGNDGEIHYAYTVFVYPTSSCTML